MGRRVGRGCLDVWGCNAFKAAGRWRVVRSWLLLIVLLIPLAAAQVPETSTVTVTGPSGSTVVSVEEAARLDFQVTFESQNPLDGQTARDIQLIVSGAPDGWTAAVSPSVLSMTAGASETVTVTVAIDTDAEDEQATIRLEARLAPRGVNVVPGLGPILDPASSGSDTADVQRDETPTRQLLETLGSFVWFILAGLLIAAVLIAKLVVDARKRTVDLQPTEAHADVGAGGKVAVPLKVRNIGNREDTVVFHLSSGDQGWSATLPLPELDLDAGQEEELQLIVHAPKDAPSGTAQTIGVTARGGQSRRLAEALVTVTVR